MQSDTTTLFTATDLATVLALLGAMSGIFMYLVKKNRDEKQTDLSIIKTEREIESIEQEIESKHAEQLKRWLNDIQEILEYPDKIQSRPVSPNTQNIGIFDAVILPKVLNPLYFILYHINP